MSKIQVNEIVNHFDTGAPDCPKGLTVTGFTTFSGGVSIGGTLTYEDVTNIDSVGLSTFQNGIHVTGGNLGIGTDNPTQLLDVAGNTTIASNGRVNIYRPTSTATNTAFQINSNVGATDSTQFIIQTGGSVGIGSDAPSQELNVAGNIMLDGGDQFMYLSSVGTGNAGIYVRGNSASSFLRSHSTGMFTWEVTGSEHMRLNSSGNLFVGDISPTIEGRLSLARDGFVQYNRVTGTGSGNIGLIIERASDNGVAVEFKRGGSVVGNINVTSTTTNYVESSDYRLKENVVDLDDAITRVKQLAPKRFNFIADADTTVDGFLAHEAATVVPEAVTGTHNEVDDENNPVYQGIDKSKLVPLLTAALQEAISEIETLKTKVAALEGN